MDPIFKYAFDVIKVSAIASVCHEANRQYCRTIGDDSQPPWDDAPEWQKASAVAGVSAIMATPHLTSEELHEGWMRQKRADGWVYGSMKDAAKKTHPCLVPYAELPEAQRRKDDLFGAIVRALTK